MYYPNLCAEQARRGMTDEAVAQAIRMKRVTYTMKKKSGQFWVSECKALCKLFDSSFDYLFEHPDKQ